MLFQGNFHHWRPLFLHFDKYFKTFLSTRNDLLLSDKILEDEDPFPKYSLLQILRVMQIILENCPNKSTFDGLEVCMHASFVSHIYIKARLTLLVTLYVYLFAAL